MSKTPEAMEPDGTLRLYRTPWKGEVLFACRKCQRKMKKHGGPPALARLKSWFKKRGKHGTPVRVIDVPCVDLCPKGGVTVFTPQQLAQQPPGVAIAWSERDLETLYCALTDVALSPEKATRN